MVSVFLLPTLDCFIARPGDPLPSPEARFLEEGEHVD